MKIQIALGTALGKAIKAKRRQLGMSQEILSEKSGLHRTYISDAERGSRNLSIQSMIRLAGGLDVPLSSLIAEAESLVRRQA
ncbi:MAG TPA: helix-turn-helix transcriptional regulator [Candidatus Obscuribacterales bacterium]